MSSALLRDSTQVERLVDQILTTLFSRYIGANEVSIASGTNESSMIAKAIASGQNNLSKDFEPILVTRN